MNPGDPDALSNPGQRGETTWTFNRMADFAFACLIPGHFEAGMRGTIRATPIF